MYEISYIDFNSHNKCKCCIHQESYFFKTNIFVKITIMNENNFYITLG